MKMFFLLYFLMGASGEAVEAFEADALNEVAITAYSNLIYSQAF